VRERLIPQRSGRETRGVKEERREKKMGKKKGVGGREGWWKVGEEGEDE